MIAKHIHPVQLKHDPIDSLMITVGGFMGSRIKGLERKIKKRKKNKCD